MNNALKGALLSGLGFPGLGQIVLKHYRRGFVLMIVVLASVLLIAVEAIQKAFTIVEKITSGGAIDMSKITEAATQSSLTTESLTAKLALFAIIICWNIGVIDAYRIGKKKDNQQQLADQAPNENGKN